MIKTRSMVAVVESVKTDTPQFSGQAPQRQIDINLGDRIRIRCTEGDALFQSALKRIRGGTILSFNYSDIKESTKEETLATGAKTRIGTGWFEITGVEITDAQPGAVSKVLEENLPECDDLQFPEARQIVTGKKTDEIPDYKPAEGEAASTEEKF